MKKVYLDAIELRERGIIGMFYEDDDEVHSAGTTICSMDAEFKKDYEKYADHYDLHFIFGDNIPSVEFYTVPQVDIVAVDSLGGYIGSIGQSFDIESDAPICYINRELECFIIAENGSDFLQNMEFWRKNLQPYHKITFYPSKADAAKELEFIDLPKEDFHASLQGEERTDS